MPTYEYRCAKCGEDLEVFQSFSEAPLTKHKGCGGKLAKVLSPAGIVLKGSGFYKTDNRSSGKGAQTEKTSEPTSSSSSSCESSSVGSSSSSSDSSSSGGEAKSRLDSQAGPKRSAPARRSGRARPTSRGLKTGVWDTGGGSRSTGRVGSSFPPLPSPATSPLTCVRFPGASPSLVAAEGESRCADRRGLDGVVLAVLVGFVTVRRGSGDLAALHRRPMRSGPRARGGRDPRSAARCADRPRRPRHSCGRDRTVTPDAVRARRASGWVVAVPASRDDVVGRAISRPPIATVSTASCRSTGRRSTPSETACDRRTERSSTCSRPSIRLRSSTPARGAAIVAAGARVLAVDDGRRIRRPHRHGRYPPRHRGRGAAVAFAAANGVVTLALAPPEARVLFTSSDRRDPTRALARNDGRRPARVDRGEGRRARGRRRHHRVPADLVDRPPARDARSCSTSATPTRPKDAADTYAITIQAGAILAVRRPVLRAARGRWSQDSSGAIDRRRVLARRD